MSRSDRPRWYHPGDVPATVRDADRAARVSTQNVVDVLASEELDAPRDRIHAMVETARERISETDPTPTHDLETPRPLQSRFVDASDVAYLGPRDFATVLGLVLSRYEGTFRTPEDVDDVAVDLLWNRQHVTVGFRTVSRPPEAPVDRDDVVAVVDGDTTPATGRSPSTLGIVSNAGFTEIARDYAEKRDVRLFGTNYLTRWFRDARLTYDVFGALLEGEHSADEIDELVDTLPPLPDTVREEDPLGEQPEVAWSGDDNGQPLQTNVERPIPVVDPHPNAGEKGALYANPDDDGDYGVFDRLLHELHEDNE